MKSPKKKKKKKKKLSETAAIPFQEYLLSAKRSDDGEACHRRRHVIQHWGF
jgi:hypothetical protein